MANGRLLAPMLLVTLVLLGAGLSKGESLDRASCEVAVEEWTEVQLGKAQELKWQLQEKEAMGDRSMPDLLFFLHIPRAGGKSYNQCFLSALMPMSVQCNMSYHVLRDDPNHACRLLATHDDYSMMERLLPGTKTFVTSVFREPVDRVISSYEFANHIAARSAGLDTSRYPDDTVMGARKKVRDHYAGLVSTDTRNIWPWTVLSIAMEEDLWTRRDFVGIPPDPVGFDTHTADMYDRPHLIIPLKEFIQLPLVHDVVHNNAVFQLVGITNNSILPEATKLRHCVIKYPELGKPMLDLAKARVDTLAHLAFTDKLNEGMALLAAMIGRSLSSNPREIPKTGWKPKCKNMRKHVDLKHPKPTLRESFLACMNQQRELTILNDKVAFNGFGDVEFSRRARKAINKDVIREIERLNALDMEITEYAREVYKKKVAAYEDYMESFERLDLGRDCI